MSRRKLSDFNAEIEAHIALEADRLQQEGMSEQQAWDTARRRFGSVMQTKERYYETTRQPWLAHIAQDLRYAARLLARNPGFAVAAVLTLALGIGANTVIFTAVDKLALHPLPFPEPARLMSIETRQAQEAEAWTSRLDFDDVRRHAQSFAAMAGISPIWNVVMTGHGEAARLETLYVSASFFSMLGVQPALGRGFADADDRSGAPGVALLSYDFWQRRFGGNTALLGQKLNMDGGVYTVIGVLPADFFYPGEPLAGKASVIDVWMPLAANQLYNSPRGLRFLKAIGRLKAGVTPEQAAGEMRRTGEALASQFASTNRGYEMTARPLEEQAGGQVRPMSAMLLGAVGLVLAMACTCVANLLLVRAAGRRREVFMRVALGASRTRLFAQLLIEGFALALCGGVAGVALAQAGLKLLIAAAPASLIGGRGMTLDGRALLFTAALVLTSAILASLPPAWRMLAAAEIGAGLRESSHSVAGGHHRLRSALVASQIGFALALLVGAGLLLRSFGRLLDVKPGFDTAHVATIATQLPAPSSASALDSPLSAATPAQRTALYRVIEERLRAVPGVKSVAAVSRLPLSGMNLGSWVWIEGRLPTNDGNPGSGAEYRVATPNYFSTMGIPLISGRVFEERDNLAASTVCVINETMARTYWRGEDPVGRRIKLGMNPEQQPWITIIGVIGDVRHVAIEAPPRPEVYRPYAQNPLGSPFLVIRVEGDPAPLLPAMAAAVRAVNPDMPAYNVFSMRELARRSTELRRFVMTLLLVFALAAVLLAAVGIYGVTAQLVAQRTREIGLRMALGATPASALRLVMASGARLALGGVAGGLLAGAALARLARRMLYQVSPLDPLVFAMAAVLLGAVAMMSCLGPAIRATRIAPMEALREE
jgi:predicted permease